MELWVTVKRESGHALVRNTCQGYNIFYLTCTSLQPWEEFLPHSTVDKTGVQWDWTQVCLVLYSVVFPVCQPWWGSGFWNSGSGISPSTSVLVDTIRLTVTWGWPLFVASLLFELQRFAVSFPSEDLNAFKFTPEIQSGGRYWLMAANCSSLRNPRDKTTSRWTWSL